MSITHNVTVADLKIHKLNVLAREGNPDELKRRVEALAKNIKENGWRSDSIITTVNQNEVIGGGTRARALQYLAAGLHKVKYNGAEYLASEFKPPIENLEIQEEGEIAKRINYLNALDKGNDGFVPHAFPSRLTLGLMSLPQVDFITQGKFSAAQVFTSCGIKATNGSEREFAACLLTLCKYFGYQSVPAHSVKMSNDARQYFGKKAKTETGEVGGLIPQLEEAVKKGEVDNIKSIGAKFSEVMAGNWSELLNLEVKPKMTKKEEIAQGVTTALTNKAALAKSKVERYVLEGKELSQDERIAFDYLHDNTKVCRDFAEMYAPKAVAHTESKKQKK